MIGAGAAGLSITNVAARLGLRVTLIERARMGGDCLNAGCVPSKALLAAGHAAQAQHGHRHQRAGVAARHHGLRLAVTQRLHGRPHGGAAAVPHDLGGLVGHGHHAVRVHHADARALRRHERPQPRGGPVQDHAGVGLALEEGPEPFGHRLGPLVAAHGVERDHGRGHGRGQGGRASGGSGKGGGDGRHGRGVRCRGSGARAAWGGDQAASSSTSSACAVATTSLPA